MKVVRRTRARRGEGEKLREEILEATERLLIRDGSVEAVSIRDIAEAVGCTPPSIYMHFEDKDALVFAVCERIFASLESVARAAREGIADPVEAVRACGRAYVRFGLEHPEQYRIMFMSRTQDSLSALMYARLRRASGFDLVVEAAQRCVDAGMFPREDAFFLACGLWSSVHGITSLMIAKPWFPWPDAERLIDHCIETHCQGLMKMKEST
ncbi:MAG TPA: TetR/AcrR family transcriptional regulator [Actinomycetota bacterium]|nr:TetR/AcrR family transcriptional regulator [Actinomycetota bacterium]